MFAKLLLTNFFYINFSIKLEIIMFFIIIFFLVIVVLLSTAFFTLQERKILAVIQNRLGPKKIGYTGILQPIVDGIKLFLKETIFPNQIFFLIFLFSSIFSFFVALNF